MGSAEPRPWAIILGEEAGVSEAPALFRLPIPAIGAHPPTMSATPQKMEVRLFSPQEPAPPPPPPPASALGVAGAVPLRGRGLLLGLSRFSAKSSRMRMGSRLLGVTGTAKGELVWEEGSCGALGECCTGDPPRGRA